jgi:hypothetical protein
LTQYELLEEGFIMKNLFPLINDTDFLFPDTIFNNLTPSRGFAQPTGTTIPDVDIEDTGTMYVLKSRFARYSKRRY